MMIDAPRTSPKNIYAATRASETLRLTSTRAEPFQVQTFVLSKAEHAHRYRLEIRAATSARALATYGSTQLPGLLGSLAFTRG